MHFSAEVGIQSYRFAKIFYSSSHVSLIKTTTPPAQLKIMKIEANHIDPKCRSGSLRLTPNNCDDIYHLSHIIAPRDIISSYTTRKISLDGGKTQQKRTMRLDISVVSVEVDLDVGIMYVKGKTCTESEFVRMGSHHTIDISVGNEFEINKKEWKNSQITKIKECCVVNPELCFVVFFERDSVVSIVSTNEIKSVYKEEIKNKNFKGLISSTVKTKPNVKSIIIAGTTDVRTEFHRMLVKQDPSIASMSAVIKLTADYKGISNSKIISKILADKAMLSTVQNVKFVDDLREGQKLFNAIDTNKEDVCIGLKEVGEAMEYGAVKMLFVTDKFCRPRSVSEREFSDAFLKRASEMGAKTCILPVGLDLGERLDSLGGVVCSLSFNYK